MKNHTTHKGINFNLKAIVTLFAILISTTGSNLFSQSLPECDTVVPLLIVDLSGSPDSTYVSPSIERVGQCCNESSNINFVSFFATLHPNVAMVEIGIYDGANPFGSGVYHFIDGGDTVIAGTCVLPTPAGQPVCIPPSIVGPDYKIAYGKPGNNENQFFFRQILKPTFPQDDSTRIGCTLPLNIYGLDSITITAINSSDGPIDIPLYNSYLDCQDCSSPVFEPGAGAPDWIDYVISGAQIASGACGVYETSDTVRIYTFGALSATYFPNPAEICAGGNITVTAAASGGSLNYNYAWVNSIQDTISYTDTNTFYTGGSFTAVIFDELVTPSCPVFKLPVSIVLSDPPTVDAGPDLIKCATDPEAFIAGSATNTSSVLWSGGLGTYTPDSTSLLMSYNPTSNEIDAGSVTLVLESTGAGGGCSTVYDTVVIYFSDTVFANPYFDPIACAGGMTTIHAGGSGGMPSYSYMWSTNSTDSTIYVSAGTYTVTISDSIGCSATGSVSVGQPTPIILTMSSTNTSTDIACDGTATVVITGGTDPYSILWSNADTTLIASNLCYGVATVEVTDTNGCVMIGSVVVNNPTCSGLSVSATDTDVLCYGDTTAQAFSFPVGGTPPYTYSWNTVPEQTTQNANNLGVGTYTITVTDSLGCVDVASVTVLQPTIITNTMTHTDVTSIGGNDGSATANPMGGTPGYTYTWIPTFQSTQTAVNLTANTYYLNILDGNSCLKVDSVQINEPPCNEFIIAVNTTNITCHGDSDGTANYVVAQGTPPFTSIWSSGEIDVNSVTGLAPGAHSVDVTDSSNCTTFQTFDITEPDTLSIALVPTNVSCNGANDGTIDLTVLGGVFPYTYSWTSGLLTVGSSEDLDNLPPGTYSIEVTDANGCTILGSVGITQPPKLLASYSYTNILCNGNDDGSIDVTPTGGTLPYSYSWTGPGGFTSSSQDIDSLGLGLYQLQITDGNGCKLGTVLQTYINEPDTVLIQTYTVSCPVPGDGVTTVTIDSISGGTWGAYQVSFNNGSTYQDAGDYTATLPIDSTYNVLAIDSNGCTTPFPTAIVINPRVMITDVTFDPCVFTGTTDIDVTVVPAGGDGGPYQVSTNGGSTFNTAGVYVISLPVDATYDIVVRDTSECESLVWQITIAAPFDASVSLTSEASCFGVADGAIDLTVVGGTTPYTFAWTGPAAYSSSSEDISGLVAGWYYVTITDDSSCVLYDSIQVTTTADGTPPVITFCPGNQTEFTDSGVCTYTNTGTGWDATATDNCSISSIVYGLSGATAGGGTSLDGVVFNLGITTVLWTVTDGSSNTATCTFDVEVIDNEAPVITTCGGSGTESVLADFGVCSYTVSGTGWDAQATDNCSILSIEYSLSGATTGSGTSLDGVTFAQGTTTVLWTVIDGSANVVSCTFDVEVTDDQPPSISTCGGIGIESVVADGGVCTYTNIGILWDAQATDNCSVSTIEYSLSGATSGSGTTLDNVVFALGTTTVLWTVTDDSGNTSTCTFDVNVADDQAPSISTCGGSGTENVIADFGVCTFTKTGIGWDAQATDNCSVSTITYSLSGATNGSGTTLNGVDFNLGTTTVLWTVVDGSGNVSTCTFDVEVSDTQNPVITSCGGFGTENVVVDLAACTYTNTGTGWDATATDNCSVSTVVYTLSGATTGSGTSLNGIDFNIGTTTVLWTVTDGSGNISTCTFDVEVADDQLPSITSCGGTGTENVIADGGVCTYTNTGTGWDATATDNCTVSTLIYTLSGATSGSGTTLDGVVFDLGTTTVLWTVTDSSGNISTCTFDVNVTDDQLPSITTCGGSGTQNVVVDAGLCSYTVSGTGWNAQAIDNCSVSTIMYSLSGATMGTGTSLNGVSFELGTTTVLWTVTDGSGNTSTCTFDVNVTDNQLPEITTCGPTGNQTVNANLSTCTYTYSGTGWNAVATDNCTVSSIVYLLSGATNGSGTSLNGVTFNLGVTLVTWTVTDGSGNTTTCSFQVTVLDDQLPVILSCGVSGTQNVNTDPGVCTYTVSGTGWDATASDNCSIASINYLLSGATTGAGSSLDGVTFAQGTTTVLWTATDGSGNTTSCTFDVVVTDFEIPVISGCLTTVIANNDLDNCGAIVTWAPPTYTDNCGATMTSTHNSGDFFPIGTTTVSYTVTDGSGNVSVCVFDVQVNDNQLPEMSCPINKESCDSVVFFATPTATDNCGVVSVTQTAGLPSGSTFPIGITIVTFEALDVNGNVNSCSFTVTIHSTPVLSTVSTDVTCNGDGDGSIDLSVANSNGVLFYAWSNGAVTQDISGLQPGIYEVDVADVYGCSATTSDTIQEPTQLILNKEVENVSCYGGVDGAIDLTVSGGVLPYGYDWGLGVIDEDLVGLSTGTYIVIVTDANGCTLTNLTSIIQPDSIDIQSVSSDATCDAANGSVSTLIVGGVSPYNYSWSNGATTSNLSNVVGGMYTLTVTDMNGCVATQTDSVGVDSNLSGYVYSTDVLCYGGNTGTALAVIESGNAPFTYTWSTGDTTNLLNGLIADSYSVYVQDAFGCEVTLDFDVYEPDSMIIFLYSPQVLEGYNISVYGGADGSIESTVYGGTDDYTYQWSTGSTLDDINNLTGGTYSLIVTDENGCTASAQISLTSPRELAMPEGLSPNGDGDNDYFVIKGIVAYPNNEITIYNRWGNVVYEQSGYNNDWQGGNNKGDPLPDGTYFVIFQPSSGAGVDPLTGYVDLRRSR